MSADKLDQIASKVPSLPEVINQLRDELDDINSTPASIERILSNDPSLSARLLKLSNSAFYGFSSKIDSVSQALMMIGLSELRSLVLASAMVKFFKGMNQDLVDMQSFWRHCVACGICARHIAIRQRVPAAERYFILGIMHDFGRLIILNSLPGKAEQAHSLAIEKRIPIVKAEEEIMKINHAVLAAQVMNRWKFPENLWAVVALHHQPSANTKYHKEASILHWADIIVDSMEVGSTGEGVIAPSPMADPNVIDKGGVASLMREVDTTAEEVFKIFFEET